MDRLPKGIDWAPDCPPVATDVLLRSRDKATAPNDFLGRWRVFAAGMLCPPFQASFPPDPLEPNQSAIAADEASVLLNACGEMPAHLSALYQECCQTSWQVVRGLSMAITVLVVDDSVTMVLSLKTTLSLNGFQVETASNGQEALNKLKAGLKPGLILTDINMPVMGGMELIRNVRGMPGLRFVPILTLTTESEAGKRNEGKLAGATGWLVKPVSGNDLVAVMRKVLPGA